MREVWKSSKMTIDMKLLITQLGKINNYEKSLNVFVDNICFFVFLQYIRNG